MSGIGIGNIRGNNVTLTIEDGTVLTGDMETPYIGENNASIVLNGDFTLNGKIFNYYAFGLSDYNSAGYVTITSGDGDDYTIIYNGNIDGAHIHLAEHVTIKLNGTIYDAYSYVKNANGSADITPTSETIGGVTYSVYVGSTPESNPVTNNVTVWITPSILDHGQAYVVFNTDNTHVPLTDTGETGTDQYNESYNICTAPLTSGATTYKVYDGYGIELTRDAAVNVSGGEIYIWGIWGTFGKDWEYKNQ